MEEEGNVEEGAAEEEIGRGQRLRGEAERITETILPKAAREHLVRAGSEMLLAFDYMIPRDKIPDDVKQHLIAAKRETLMIWKCLLDAQLSVIKEMEREPQEEEPSLRKIELD